MMSLYQPISSSLHCGSRNLWTVRLEKVTWKQQLYVLRAVLKRANLKQDSDWQGVSVPFCKWAFLKHVSNWHCANIVISKLCVKLCKVLKHKEKRQEAWPSCICLFCSKKANVFPQYDCLHGVNLKHASEIHIFHNSTMPIWKNGTQLKHIMHVPLIAHILKLVLDRCNCWM